MPTVTVKMSPAQHARLKRVAERRRTSQSEVLREAVDQLDQSNTPIEGSFVERAGHLIGSLDGPGDLSALSKEMKGYGESRHP
ncbi:MAG: ribbon-helix-helix protein, CopG family [Opitutaceae bacterium]|jgi:Arc/MetJ-type ribon-helix-helix transcriptional regulator|nr:ribbon-helix-helix protein, CopG family [Opitutaceae bacterium]